MGKSSKGLSAKVPIKQSPLLSIFQVSACCKRFAPAVTLQVPGQRSDGLSVSG